MSTLMMFYINWMLNINTKQLHSKAVTKMEFVIFNSLNHKMLLVWGWIPWQHILVTFNNKNNNNKIRNYAICTVTVMLCTTLKNMYNKYYYNV